MDDNSFTFFSTLEPTESGISFHEIFVCKNITNDYYEFVTYVFVLTNIIYVLRIRYVFVIYMYMFVIYRVTNSYYEFVNYS